MGYHHQVDTFLIALYSPLAQPAASQQSSFIEMGADAWMFSNNNKFWCLIHS
jgi:hypothetical protein